MLVGVLMVSCWLLLIAMQYWLVRFRLTSTFTSPFRSGILRSGILTRSQQAYHPPATVTGLRRPSIVFALLWQQMRQVRSLVGGLLLIGLLCVWRSTSGFDAIVGMVPTLVLAWIGVATFYGDSIKNRRGFYAEKGISPTMVWWTRVLPTIVPAILLLALSAFAVSFIVGRTEIAGRNYFLFGAAMYCFGVFVSQWSLRPMLAFFGAPAILGLCLTPLGFWFSMYPSYLTTVIGLSVVVLFGSWRLMRPWMDGRYEWQSRLQTLGYLALAITTPMAITIADRVWTTPSAMSDWESATMAMAIPPAPSGRLVSSTNRIASAARPKMGVISMIDDDITKRLRDELAHEDWVGRHVTFEELEYLASHSPVTVTSRTFDFDPEIALPDRAKALAESKRGLQNEQLAAEVSLAWANRVYQFVIDGNASLSNLMAVGEPSEMLARMILRRHSTDDPTWNEIRSKVPSDSFRKRARTAAVVAEWKRYRLEPWYHELTKTYSKDFAGKPLASSPLWFERKRTDRIVDRITRLLLEQIQTDHQFATSQSRVELARLWNDARMGTRAFRFTIPNNENHLIDWTNSMTRLNSVDLFRSQ